MILLATFKDLVCLPIINIIWKVPVVFQYIGKATLLPLNVIILLDPIRQIRSVTFLAISLPCKVVFFCLFNKYECSLSAIC